MRDMNVTEYQLNIGLHLMEAMMQARCEPHAANGEMSKAYHDLVMTIGIVDLGRDALANGNKARVKPGQELSDAQVNAAKQVIFEKLDRMRKALDGVEQFYRTV